MSVGMACNPQPQYHSGKLHAHNFSMPDPLLSSLARSLQIYDQMATDTYGEVEEPSRTVSLVKIESLRLD